MIPRVMVIGGGAIGLFAAYYLRKNGMNVTVVEKDAIGGGCSAQNAGLIVPSHFVPLASPGILSRGLKSLLVPSSPFYIKPRISVELARWLWRFVASANKDHVTRSMPLLKDLHQASLSLYDELSRTHTFDFGFEKRGLLLLYRSADGLAECEELEESARVLGIEVRHLDNTQLQAMEPDIPVVARGGVFFPGDAHLNPGLLLSSLSTILREEGVEIRTNTKVLGFATKGETIEAVKTDKGDLAGSAFVLAGGYWSSLIARTLHIKLPLQAGKGYSVTVRNPGHSLRTPCICTEARLAITPMGKTIRLAGTMELAGPDNRINIPRVDAMLGSASSYFTGILPDDFHRTEAWIGYRPCSPDGLPYIGRFRRYRNLIAATGHAMIGMSLAPVTGRLVAEIVQNRPTSIDIAPLNPDRFA